MSGPTRDKDLLADLLVFIAASLVMALALLPAATQDTPASTRPDPALVHELELVAIAHSASEQLPAEIKAQIGLTNEPLATRKGVLEEIARHLSALPPSADLEVIRIALGVGWGEDALAQSAVAALARVPEVLASRGKELDELTRLSSGLPAKTPDDLISYLQGVGASRWLVGLVRARHLANANDPAHTALAADMDSIARSVALRHAIFFGLGVGLISLGTLLFVLFPGVIRPRLEARRLVHPLPPTPFILERTRRVVLGWFAAAHLGGYVVGYMVVSFGGAPSFVQPIAGLVSGLVAVLLIRHWGLPPDSDTSLARALTLTPRVAVPSSVLGLTRRALWVVVGTCAALAVAVAVTWVFEVLNQMVIGGPPDTQSAVKQLMASGDTMALVTLGVSAVIIAPLAEEILFRGFLFRNLRETIGKGLAAVLSGLFFGLVHMHPTLLIPLTGLGIALALLYEWTGSLWVPILAHMAFNLLTLIRVEAIWRI